MPSGERRSFWGVIVALCAIGIAISVRRLVLLIASPADGGSSGAALEAGFAAKPVLTASHVLMGFLLVVAIPVQFSARIRRRYPRAHRRLGRVVLVVGVLVGGSAYGMMVDPVGGWLEISATSLYGTFFMAALLAAWWYIRHGDVPRHREWMLRAVAAVLGIATTRPIMALFFATSRITGLTPPQFFGMAMWLGFTTTVLAAEWYIRSTRISAQNFTKV